MSYEVIPLSQYYYKIRKNIELVTAYTERHDLEFIIKSCKLKPYYDRVLNTPKLRLNRIWVDEFGNKLMIGSKDEIHAIFNDLVIDRKYYFNYDFFGMIDLTRALRIAKYVYVLCGYDQVDDKFLMISVLCDDNIMRAFYYENGEWVPCSPLLIGLDGLREIYNNIGIHLYRKFNNHKDSYFPVKRRQVWFSAWKPMEAFLLNLKKFDDNLYYILK